MKTERTIEILHNLGFRLEDLTEHGFGYRLEYEGVNILFDPDEDDPTSLNFFAPRTADITDENRSFMLEKMQELISTYKYVQPAIVGDAVNIYYFHYLGEEEPNEKTIEHIIRVVGFTTRKFRELTSEQ